MIKLVNKYFPEITDVQTEKLIILHELFETYNKKINLISNNSLNNFFVEHVLHSLSISKIKQKKLVIIVALSSLPAFFWAFYNPLYTQGVQTELSYRSIDANDGTNWANTFVFTPSHVYTPANADEIQHIVLNSSKVRVVGGGHSWAPLIETDGSLISMDNFKNIEIDGSNVIVGAGVSIQDLTTYLEMKQMIFDLLRFHHH